MRSVLKTKFKTDPSVAEQRHLLCSMNHFLSFIPFPTDQCAKQSILFLFPPRETNIWSPFFLSFICFFLRRKWSPKVFTTVGSHTMGCSQYMPKDTRVDANIVKLEQPSLVWRTMTYMIQSLVGNNLNGISYVKGWNTRALMFTYFRLHAEEKGSDYST